MLMVPEVCPAAMVSVSPLAAVMSVAAALSPDPIEVLYCTVTSAPAAYSRVTAKSTLDPSAPVPSVTLISGLPSLSRMVAVADVVVPSAAFDDGLDRVTVKVSSSSASESSVVAMLIVPDVSPAAMVSVCAEAAV